jgi:hypothetical protein
MLFGLVWTWSLVDLRTIFLDSIDNIRNLHIVMSCRFIHEEQMFYPHHPKKILKNLHLLKLDYTHYRKCRYNHPENTLVFVELLHLAPNLQSLYCSSDHGNVQRIIIDSILKINSPKLQNLLILNEIPDDLVIST